MKNIFDPKAPENINEIASSWANSMTDSPHGEDSPAPEAAIELLKKLGKAIENAKAQAYGLSPSNIELIPGEPKQIKSKLQAKTHWHGLDIPTPGSNIDPLSI